VDTKTKISQAAARLFFTYGYEKTTLRMIGEEVGIAHVSILSHFNNKMDIAAAAVENYLSGLKRKCDELFEGFPKTIRTKDEYYRNMLWWTMHFKLLSDNRAFREFYMSFYREGPVILTQPHLVEIDESKRIRITVQQANDFVLRSLVTALDANLASLIGFGMVDYVQAARLIMLQGGVIGFTPDFSPTEAEIRKFADKYLAGVEVDVLNEFLLVQGE